MMPFRRRQDNDDKEDNNVDDKENGSGVNDNLKSEDFTTTNSSLPGRLREERIETSLETIPEVSSSENFDIHREDTFVVATWKDILGDEETSANLRHRKAVALAKVNARHVIEQWQHHRASSSLSSSSSSAAGALKHSDGANMRRHERHFIDGKGEAVGTTNGEMIYFQWDRNISLHRPPNKPAAINKLHNFKRKRLQAKKIPIEGFGSKSAPNGDQARRSSSSGRRQASSHAKEKAKAALSGSVQTKSHDTLSSNAVSSHDRRSRHRVGDMSQLYRPQPPKEAFIESAKLKSSGSTPQTVKLKTTDDSVKNVSKPGALNKNISSPLHPLSEGQTDSDKENNKLFNLEGTKTFHNKVVASESRTSHSQRHKNEVTGSDISRNSASSKKSVKSNKNVSFAADMSSYSNLHPVTDAATQKVGATYLGLHQHKKNNMSVTESGPKHSGNYTSNKKENVDASSTLANGHKHNDLNKKSENTNERSEGRNGNTDQDKKLEDKMSRNKETNNKKLMKNVSINNSKDGMSSKTSFDMGDNPTNSQNQTNGLHASTDDVDAIENNHGSRKKKRTKKTIFISDKTLGVPCTGDDSTSAPNGSLPSLLSITSGAVNTGGMTRKREGRGQLPGTDDPSPSTMTHNNNKLTGKSWTNNNNDSRNKNAGIKKPPPTIGDKIGYDNQQHHHQQHQQHHQQQHDNSRALTKPESNGKSDKGEENKNSSEVRKHASSSQQILLESGENKQQVTTVTGIQKHQLRPRIKITDKTTTTTATATTTTATTTNTTVYTKSSRHHKNDRNNNHTTTINNNDNNGHGNDNNDNFNDNTGSKTVPPIPSPHVGEKSIRRDRDNGRAQTSQESAATNGAQDTDNNHTPGDNVYTMTRPHNSKAESVVGNVIGISMGEMDSSPVAFDSDSLKSIRRVGKHSDDGDGGRGYQIVSREIKSPSALSVINDGCEDDGGGSGGGGGGGGDGGGYDDMSSRRELDVRMSLLGESDKSLSDGVKTRRNINVNRSTGVNGITGEGDKGGNRERGDKPVVCGNESGEVVKPCDGDNERDVFVCCDGNGVNTRANYDMAREGRESRSTRQLLVVSVAAAGPGREKGDNYGVGNERGDKSVLDSLKGKEDDRGSNRPASNEGDGDGTGGRAGDSACLSSQDNKKDGSANIIIPGKRSIPGNTIALKNPVSLEERNHLVKRSGDTVSDPSVASVSVASDSVNSDGGIHSDVLKRNSFPKISDSKALFANREKTFKNGDFRGGVYDTSSFDSNSVVNSKNLDIIEKSEIRTSVEKPVSDRLPDLNNVRNHEGGGAVNYHHKNNSEHIKRPNEVVKHHQNLKSLGLSPAAKQTNENNFEENYEFSDRDYFNAVKYDDDDLYLESMNGQSGAILDNLRFRNKTMDQRNGDHTGHPKVSEDLVSLKLNTKDVIYTKPVLVRPRTAGLSSYGNDHVFGDGQDVGLWYNALDSDRAGYDEIYDDDDIKFINDDNDYYEVFGYDEDTKKILEATRVYPVPSSVVEYQSRRDLIKPSIPQHFINFDHTNNSKKTDKEVKLDYSSKNTAAIKSLKTDHTANFSKRNTNSYNNNINNSKKTEEEEICVTLSNEEKQSKCKDEVKEMVARSESDDSIYKQSQNSFLYRHHSKILPKGSVPTSRKSLVKIDSNVKASLQSTSSKMLTGSSKNLNLVSTGSNVTFEYKSKTVVRNKKFSFETLREESCDATKRANPNNGADMRSDSINKAKNENDRVVNSNQTLTKNKPFTKARRRIRSEPDMNRVEITPSHQVKHGENIHNINSRTVGTTFVHDSITNSKKPTTYSSSTGLLNANHPPSSNDKSSAANANSVSHQLDMHVKQIKTDNLKTKNNNTINTTKGLSKVSTSKTNDKNINNEGIYEGTSIEPNAFLNKDQYKKSHTRHMSITAHPETYEEKLERMKKKFAADETNLRLSQSFNGQGNTAFNDNNNSHVPQTSLKNKTMLDDAPILKGAPASIRAPKKSMLTPLVAGREKETNSITTHLQLMHEPTPPVKPRKLKPIMHHSSAQRQRQGLTSGLLDNPRLDIIYVAMTTERQ